MRKDYSLIISLIKEAKKEYRRPVKALLWAMAISQWMVIAFFGSFFLAFLFSVLQKSFGE